MARIGLGRGPEHVTRGVTLDPREIAHARTLLEGARSILVLTGAGISAESGVPTFRGDGGLWRTHKPEDLATPEAFRRDPRLVWEWYGWRRELITRCRPNPGHRALASWALANSVVTLVTQNVDGLHDAAARDVADGRKPERAFPIELHGSLFRVRCTLCEYRAPDRAVVDASGPTTLPHCPQCGALLRPDVVWFGESLDTVLLDRAFRAAEAAEVCLGVGTSALVHPAASLPLATLRSGGKLVEVNPDPTVLTTLATVSLRANSGETMHRLLPGY
jgi:NAD-dependent deacetylase